MCRALLSALRRTAPALCSIAVVARVAYGGPTAEPPHPWDSSLLQFGAHYGSSVASAGDVNGDGYSDLIVGAPDYDSTATNQGRAFVFYGNATLDLGTVPAWEATETQARAGFGSSVASAGDVNGDGFADVLVSAPYFDDGPQNVGKVCLYLGSASGLPAAPSWTVQGTTLNQSLGLSLASAGDVNGDGYADVIVGMFGGARIYLGSPAGLANTPAWSVQQGAAERFGGAVASAGDVNADGYDDVLVGAQYDSNALHNGGRVTLYLGSPAGLSTTPAWTGEGDQADEVFGTSVSAAGDVNADGYADVIVGAPGYSGSVSGEGGAFIYFGSAAGLSAQPSWSASGGQTGSFFGFSVTTAGDVNDDGYADVLVGAYEYNVDPLVHAGAGFLYCGAAGGPSAGPTFMAARQQHDEGVGYAVAPAGDVNADGYSDFVIGGPYYDYQADGITYGGSDVGRVTVWSGSPSWPVLASGWHGEGDLQQARFGSSTGSAGDVNGDGFSDLIVGAPYFSDGETDEGKAVVYFGGVGGLASSPAWAAEGTQVGAHFGASVSTAGDVNGDGYADVMVGAPFYDGNLTDEGRVLVYLGSPSGLSPSFSSVIYGEQAGAHLGASVACAGDVNGDGYSDVLVGAPESDHGEADEGRVFLYLGSAEGLNPVPVWTVEGDQAGAAMGASVASAGDVNGDGFSDVIVGTSRWDRGQLDEGRVTVYLGSAAGLSTTPAWSAEGDQAGALFGASVGTAGDVDGDGFSDVIVGAPRFHDWQSDEGEVFVYRGSASGLGTSAFWRFSNDQISAELGTSVATAGDINGDGYSDIVVGAPFFDDGEADEGRAYVWLGSPSGLGARLGISGIVWTGEGNQVGALFGATVAPAGDVDGDGYADLVVGAPYDDQGQFDEGKVFLYLGNGGGLARGARQLQPDGSGPIGPLGKSRSAAFRIAATGRSPAGRAHVWMEWEAKPLGQPFVSTGHGVEPAFDTGPPQPGLGSEASLVGLALVTPELPYRWRFRLHSDSPIWPVSRWFFLAANGASETDLRTGTGVTGISRPLDPIRALRLDGVRPNPSNQGAIVSFTLPRSGHVVLRIRDLQGRTVASLLDGPRGTGPQTVRWDGRDRAGRRLPSGIYWAWLSTGGETVSRKLVRD